MTRAATVTAMADGVYRVEARSAERTMITLRREYAQASALAHSLLARWPAVAVYGPDGRRCWAVER